MFEEKIDDKINELKEKFEKLKKMGYENTDFPNVKVLSKSAWAEYKNKLKSGYKISQEVDYKN